jgi:hypothetical protein
MNGTDRRAYVRARLVALAEEVHMVTRQKPTEDQLRQAALDRAVQEGVVNGVYAGMLDPGNMTGPDTAALAAGITKVADVFADYLRGGPKPEPEEPAFTVTNTPDLGLVTTGDLLTEVQARFNHIDDGGVLAGQCLAFRRSLPGYVLNYRTADAS